MIFINVYKLNMVKRCQWGQCNSDSRYKERDCMKNVFFIPFTKPWINKEKCLLWIKMCGRPHSQLNATKITKDTYICSKHFVGGNGPTEDYPDPTSADPLTQNPRKRRSRESSSVYLKSRRTEQQENTSIDNQPGTSQTTTNKGRPIKSGSLAEKLKNVTRPIELYGDLENVATNDISITEDESAHSKKMTLSKKLDHLKQGKCLSDIPKVTTTKANKNSYECGQCGSSCSPNANGTKTATRKLFIDEVTKDDKTCFYYTGVPTVTLLTNLFNWIEPVAKKTTLWSTKKKKTPKTETGQTKRGRPRKILSLYEEFILTLVRIRRGFRVTHLKFLFGVSPTHISRIFITWVNILSRYLEQLIVWPERNVVQENMPKSFQLFPNTRCIIDCSEIFVEKAFRPSAQRTTWSNYKHSNTFKFLVGIAPTGAISFLSKLYTGSISDASIVEKSGFIDKVEEGDDIMADRGFNIRHLLLPKKATLNIPAFSHGGNLSAPAIIKSRKIASVRIHVERAIRRIKTFRILNGTMPLKIRYLANQIMKIVCGLCNLQQRLVKL